MSYTDARSSRGTTLGDICASTVSAGGPGSGPHVSFTESDNHARKNVLLEGKHIGTVFDTQARTGQRVYDATHTSGQSFRGRTRKDAVAQMVNYHTKNISSSAPTSGFVKSQPAIAVKSPSFKAPKVIGKKPPIIAKGKKVKAGGPGSGRRKGEDAEDWGFDPSAQRVGIKSGKGKLKAGGPGSGRKPNIGKDPQLNKMHNTLTRQGFTYRDSTNKKDSSGNYVDHAYTNSDHTKVAHLEDHENGNHQVRTNPTSAAD